MTIQEYFNQYNGKGIDYDGFYGDQCMDNFLQYNQDVVGALRVLGNAVDVWTSYPKDFYDQIPNTPDNSPQEGDVIIWGTGIGQYGHIAICQSGDVNSFVSFDQNWNGHQYCEFVTHNYNSVLGWIRPKAQPQQSVAVDPTKFAQLVDKSTKYDGFNAAGYATIDDVTKRIGDLQNELTQSQTAIKTLNDKVTTLTATVQADAQQDYDLSSKNLALEHQLNDIVGALGISPSSTEDAILAAIKSLKTPHDEVVKQVQPTLDGLADAAFKKSRSPQVKSFIQQVKEFFGWR